MSEHIKTPTEVKMEYLKKLVNKNNKNNNIPKPQPKPKE